MTPKQAYDQLMLGYYVAYTEGIHFYRVQNTGIIYCTDATKGEDVDSGMGYEFLKKHCKSDTWFIYKPKKMDRGYKLDPAKVELAGSMPKSEFESMVDSIYSKHKVNVMLKDLNEWTEYYYNGKHLYCTINNEHIECTSGLNRNIFTKEDIHNFFLNKEIEDWIVKGSKKDVKPELVGGIPKPEFALFINSLFSGSPVMVKLKESYGFIIYEFKGDKLTFKDTESITNGYFGVNSAKGLWKFFEDKDIDTWIVQGPKDDLEQMKDQLVESDVEYEEVQPVQINKGDTKTYTEEEVQAIQDDANFVIKERTESCEKWYQSYSKLNNEFAAAVTRNINLQGELASANRLVTAYKEENEKLRLSQTAAVNKYDELSANYADFVQKYETTESERIRYAKLAKDLDNLYEASLKQIETKFNEGYVAGWDTRKMTNQFDLKVKEACDQVERLRRELYNYNTKDEGSTL